MSEVSDPIFARIAARYDLINRVLSLGQEKRWRSRGIEMLGRGTVLDLGCGTGATDFEGRGVVGLDPVIEMLALSPVRDRVVGTGETLPFQEASLDAVFSGFVFRNLSSIDDTLAEIDRVLKPGSTAVVVDLARPRNGRAPDSSIGSAPLSCSRSSGSSSPAPHGSTGTSTDPWTRCLPPKLCSRAMPSPPSTSGAWACSASSTESACVRRTQNVQRITRNSMIVPPPSRPCNAVDWRAWTRVRPPCVTRNGPLRAASFRI